MNHGNAHSCGLVQKPPPRNAGHMTHVYESVVPVVKARVTDWTRDLRATGAEWGFEGGGLVKPLLGDGQRGSRARLSADAASCMGGKMVNQDSAGWVVFGDGAETMAVASVADGVTSSLYSEFGSALAVAGALKVGVRWLRESSCKSLSFSLFASMGEIQEAMLEGVGSMRAALAGFVASGTPSGGRATVDEARRQLDILADPERDPMCTTVLLVAVGRSRIAGVVVGNGAVYKVHDGICKQIWWDTSSDEVSEHLGSRNIPALATFEFEEPWSPSVSGVYGVATDGVGGIDSFNLGRNRLPQNVSSSVLLETVVADMGHRRVSADLIDNLAVAEIRNMVQSMAGRGMGCR